MIANPTSLVIFSYSTLITILLLPQVKENKKQYWTRLKVIALMIVPILISVININCISQSCSRFADIMSWLISLWCFSVMYIYMFKKLI